MAVLLGSRIAFFVFTLFCLTRYVCSDENPESLKETVECTSSDIFRKIMMQLIKSLQMQVDNGESNVSAGGSSVNARILPTVTDTVVTEVFTTTLFVWFRNQRIASVVTSTIVRTMLPAGATEELTQFTSTVTPEAREGRRVREIEVEPSFALINEEAEVQYVRENSMADKVVEDPRVTAAIDKLKMVLQEVYREHNMRESRDEKENGF